MSFAHAIDRPPLLPGDCVRCGAPTPIARRPSLFGSASATSESRRDARPGDVGHSFARQLPRRRISATSLPRTYGRGDGGLHRSLRSCPSCLEDESRQLPFHGVRGLELVPCTTGLRSCPSCLWRRSDDATATAVWSGDGVLARPDVVNRGARRVLRVAAVGREATAREAAASRETRSTRQRRWLALFVTLT
jgi:hypothetical protein